GVNVVSVTQRATAVERAINVLARYVLINAFGRPLASARITFSPNLHVRARDKISEYVADRRGRIDVVVSPNRRWVLLQTRSRSNGTKTFAWARLTPREMENDVRDIVGEIIEGNPEEVRP